MVHPVLNKQITEAKELIESHDNIGLFTHHDPDGDAIGSISAMHLCLKRLGKNVTSIISGTYSDNYNFLPLPLFKKELPAEKFELAIILDASDSNRTGYQEEISHDDDLFIINIDHHPQEQGFGNLNIVDEKATSSAELVFYILNELNTPIDRDLASLLLTGIISDTASFKHSNTTAKSLEIASFLASRGGDIKNISEKTERHKKLSTLKLWGRVLSRIKSDRRKGIVTSVIKKDDLVECGATKEDLEGVVNLISTIPESKAALLLREDEEGQVKGSLRSDPGGLDVRKVAHVFGGGGHVRASGFRIRGKIKETSNGWEIVDD